MVNEGEGEKPILETEYEILFIVRDFLELCFEAQKSIYGAPGEFVSKLLSETESYIRTIDEQLFE